MDMHARVPEHVVFREFALETVVLNLESGQYHRLNATGGRMLELLNENGSVADAADALAAQFTEAAATVPNDLCAFCRALSKRGLIELTDR